MKNSHVIEFGSATGQMTELLRRISKTVTAVDGSRDFIETAKNRIGDAENVEFHESYFEDFKIDKKFDCVIMHHVLEHIINPTSLLFKMKGFINEGGIIAISVPNANAFSRQLAVKMNILSSVYELTDNDKRHGHYRVYDWNMLEETLEYSGFGVLGKYGLCFKLFSDKQNIEILKEGIIGEEQMKGLWLLGDEYPHFAGAIMIVAKVGELD